MSKGSSELDERGVSQNHEAQMLSMKNTKTRIFYALDHVRVFVEKIRGRLLAGEVCNR
jgi:hypothetical protein